MKAIDVKGKVRLLFSILLAVLLFQGTQYAQNKSDNKDNAYNRVAKDLTSRLSKRVNLTKDQIGKVQDILVDYQKDIADKWDKSTADNTSSKGVTDDFRDADKKANDKIEKTLNGNEITAYMNAKKDWWAKIKDRVFSRDFIDLVNYKEDENANNVGSTERNKNTRNANEKTTDKSDNTSGGKDLSTKFEPFAKQMATELMQKLNLSLQQAADIQDALIDYQKSIADIRERSMKNDNTGSNVRVAKNERNRNADNRSESVGSSNRNDRMSQFRDIDDDANSKLEKVLNDNQKTKYERAKKQWWREVKDKVFANVQKENKNVNSK